MTVPVVFLAAGAGCGIVQAVLRPFVKRRATLFFADFVTSVAAGLIYLASTHFFNYGKIEFWSSGLFCLAQIATYWLAKTPVAFLIGRTSKALLLRLKKSPKPD